MSRRLPFAAALAALAFVVLTACGETSGGPTTTTSDAGATTTEAVHVIEVSVEGGRAVGGPRREEVALGSAIRLIVRSDVADEVHVHTYDLIEAIPSGGMAEIEFVADIPGVIEVELEGRHTLILTLEIRP